MMLIGNSQKKKSRIFFLLVSFIGAVFFHVITLNSFYYDEIEQKNYFSQQEMKIWNPGTVFVSFTLL